MSKLCGFMHPDGDRAYFFTGDRYVRYNVADDAVDPGYPKPIAGNWPGLFASGIDAAVSWTNGTTYFFRGSEYVRFSWADSRVDDGYPMRIADGWPGIFTSDIDAALMWSNGQAYFFRGGEYVKYDPATDTVAEGYPRAITDGWTGVFDSGIETALLWPSGNGYFFHGAEYVRYEPGTNQVVDGYPRPILGDWPGLPIGASGGGPAVGDQTAIPARALSKEAAHAELDRLQAEGWITFDPSSAAGKVDLDGLDPATGTKQDGNVAGVVIRYLESGTRTHGSPSSPNAPDRLDPRHAVALVRFCQWLATTWGVTELYHLGAGGDPSGARTDCHGQGRAIDFVGVKGSLNGQDFHLTVADDWGTVDTPSTPGGVWEPRGTNQTHFRLDDVDHPFERDFFRGAYDAIAGQWQDATSGPAPADTPTVIGRRSFIMNPDHHSSAPGKSNGRESHANHLHMQIGVTGTE